MLRRLLRRTDPKPAADRIASPPAEPSPAPGQPALPAASAAGVDPLIEATPLSLDLDARIAMGLRCGDCDFIPKVAGAGSVATEADGTRVQIMHNGLRVVADGYYGAWMTRLIELARGHHEPQEEAAFHALMHALPPGGTMVELGGFWAYYTLWFLTSAPGRRALLVEPDPAHIEIGRRNLALNGIAAEFVQGFVGAVPGRTVAFRTEESGTLDLPCIDLPALLDARKVDHLTLLHCDAQGAETAVLDQIAPLVRQGRLGWVFVSTHHHAISGDPLTHQRCLALLAGLGATIEVEHDVQESFSGDGMIVGRFCDAPAGWRAPPLSYNRASTSLFRHPLFDLAAAQAR